MLCFKLLSQEFYIFQRTILSCRFINLLSVQADTTSIARDCIEELIKKLNQKVIIKLKQPSIRLSFLHFFRKHFHIV